MGEQQFLGGLLMDGEPEKVLEALGRLTNVVVQICGAKHCGMEVCSAISIA
jgi:hypothetical protein